MVIRSSIHRILTRELYPFHFTPVQHLLPRDPSMRLQFCKDSLNSYNNDPSFLNNVLFTGQITFTRRWVTTAENNYSRALKIHPC